MDRCQEKNLIGKRIKQLRQKNNLTQEKLAIKAGVPYTTLTKIESGVIKKPSVQTIAKIAKALGVPIENLLK
ncbi:MAG: helix-turn-helix transcriptional regulator [Candidatus Aminicenantes bacterium]|nr:helix-turn-helix transcriptional regulator [Candidatus Aminicenantes bacterium]